MKHLELIENKVRGSYVTLNTLKNYGEMLQNEVEYLEKFKDDVINTLTEILPVLEEVFFEDVDEARQSLK
mgnify:FL=1